MATYAKSSQEVFASIPKNDRGEFLQVSRIIPENKNSLESIDIRLLFTAMDPNEGPVLKPTQKGVRINSETIPEVFAAVYKAMSVEERQEFSDLIASVDKLEEEAEE